MSAVAETQKGAGFENPGRAYLAFLAVLEAGLEPTLDCSIQSGNDWRKGEYDVLVKGNSTYGVLHEQIVTLLGIAEEHGGRLWLDRTSSMLCILFPYEKPQGPDGEDTPAQTERKKSRKVAA